MGRQVEGRRELELVGHGDPVEGMVVREEAWTGERIGLDGVLMRGTLGW